MTRPETSERPTRWVVVVAVAALVVAVLVTRSCGVSTPSDSTTPVLAAVSPSTHGPVGPTARRHGVAVGWRHDLVGAQAAAVSDVADTAVVTKAGPLSRGDVIDAIASTGYAPQLLAATSRQLDTLTAGLDANGAGPAGLVWSEYPLTVRSGTYTAGRVTVRVWSVLIVAVEGAAVPRQLWRTSTLRLVWQDHDWKIDRWDTSTGPTPGLGDDLDVSSVNAVAQAVDWPRATAGGS